MATDPHIDSLFDGRYRIVKKLGAGGMANVYLAEDQELGRRVAIKILNERHANDEQFVARFRQEAKNAAALTHPNIVSIYDRGEAQGTYYIAMEYIDGRSLKELIISRGPAPIGIAAEYVRQVLSALRFAHRHGIVHRDIKPHNVLVDGEGRVKVTDFGIARAGASQMTEAGSIVGTAQYLSPEQARGGHVDQRSDLYSLGVVLYELLTGEMPFEGDTPVEIAMKHLSAIPQPPSTMRPELPRELDLVVMRALAKEPDERYQSAEEMDADLERVARGAPLAAATEEGATRVMRIPAAVSAAAPTTFTAPVGDYAPREERPRRRSTWPWLVALAFVVVAGVAGWYAYSQLSSSSAPKVAVGNYVSLKQGDAKLEITQAGFVASVKQDTSDSVAAGLVFKQSPADGDLATKGSTVTIWVSTGKPKVAVPNVVGAKQDDAVKQITDAKLNPDVHHVPGGTAGVVTAVSPAVGTQVAEGTTVRVNVATGPAPVAVPKVTGESLNQASSDLHALGFSVNPTYVDSNQPANQVILQNPKPGDQAPKGSTVDLKVSNGPPMATVPDVRGEQSDLATQQLTAAGFKVTSHLQNVSDPTQAGQVLEQSPGGNSQAAQGSTVTISVGNYVAPPVTTPGTTTSPTDTTTTATP